MHVLVTGGARGIGAAACRLAGARGWDVTVNYLNDAVAAEATASAVRDAGGRAVAVRGDVALEADTLALFDAAEAAFGPLEGVVANAGIVAPPSRLVDMDVERMRRVVDVNLIGALVTAREAARRMRGGSLVLVSSVASRVGSPNEYVDYAAAKGGVDTLTLGLAKELGPAGIRVNAVRPGTTATEIHARNGTPDRAARVGATMPLGRAGEPEEVAEAIVWLLSDAAAYVSGAILDVTGGR